MTLAKNRRDIVGETVNIERHVCLGRHTVADTAKKHLHKIMSESGHEPESFPDKIIFSSMFSDVPDYGSERCKQSVWTAQKKRPLTQQDSELVIGVSVVQARNRLGKTMSQDQISHSADGEWDKLASVMMSELVTSKHSGFKSNMFLDIEERETWNALHKRIGKQSHARAHGTGVQSTLYFFTH